MQPLIFTAMKTTLLLFILLSATAFAQRYDNTWCFGDSAKINFNGGTVNPQGLSSTLSSELASSISDYNGNLLFYVGSDYNLIPFRDIIWNKYDQIMQNGDSIIGDYSVTNGSII